MKSYKLGFVVFLLLWRIGYSENRALIVVNCRYDGEEGYIASPKDIVVAQELALKFGFKRNQIKIVKDANSKEFQESAKWLMHEVTSYDAVFFYYSGHAIRVRDIDGDEVDGFDEALEMVDGSIVIDDKLGRWLESIPAGRKLIVMDCCYAEGTLKSIGVEEVPFLLPFDKESDVMLAAAEERKAITASEPNKPSEFTNLLYDAIIRNKADKNRDHIVTIEELRSYINSNDTPILVKTPLLDCINLTDFANKAVFSKRCIENNILFKNLIRRRYMVSSKYKVYKVGDLVELDIFMPFDGFVYLFEITPNNEIQLLFPTNKIIINKFRKGLRINIAPNLIRVHAVSPVGESLIIAIVTSNNLSIEDIVGVFSPSPFIKLERKDIERLKQNLSLKAGKVVWDYTSIKITHR